MPCSCAVAGVPICSFQAYLRCDVQATASDIAYKLLHQAMTLASPRLLNLSLCFSSSLSLYNDIPLLCRNHFGCCAYLAACAPHTARLRSHPFYEYFTELARRSKLTASQTVSHGVLNVLLAPVLSRDMQETRVIRAVAEL